MEHVVFKCIPLRRLGNSANIFNRFQSKPVLLYKSALIDAFDYNNVVYDKFSIRHKVHLAFFACLRKKLQF